MALPIEELEKWEENQEGEQVLVTADGMEYMSLIRKIRSRLKRNWILVSIHRGDKYSSRGWLAVMRKPKS